VLDRQDLLEHDLDAQTTQGTFRNVPMQTAETMGDTYTMDLTIAATCSSFTFSILVLLSFAFVFLCLRNQLLFLNSLASLPSLLPRILRYWLVM